jgi:hypothetical protein
MKAQLWDRRNNATVSADVLPAMTPEQLVQTEGRWQKFRVRARRRRRVGVPVPEHNHWNWDEKSHDLKFTAYRCLGIWYDDEVQGLMMISILAVQGRARAHRAKPVLYIKYIEGAPWNLKAYVGEEARFGGVGVSLIGPPLRLAWKRSFEDESRFILFLSPKRSTKNLWKTSVST